MESATATRDARLGYGAEARPTLLAHVRDYVATELARFQDEPRDSRVA